MQVIQGKAFIQEAFLTSILYEGMTRMYFSVEEHNAYLVPHDVLD